MKQVFTKILTFSLVSAALTSACVRKRPVEQKYDFDGDRWEKAQFADGREWIGQVTITNNGSNGAFGFVGNVTDPKIGHFNFTKDKLQFLETDTVTNTDSKEQRVINEWDINHSEYHQKLSGGRVSNIETENEEISWKDKKFFKVNWNAASISEAASFPWEIDDYCWKATNTRVDNEENDIGPGAASAVVDAMPEDEDRVVAVVLGQAASSLTAAVRPSLASSTGPCDTVVVVGAGMAGTRCTSCPERQHSRDPAAPRPGGVAGSWRAGIVGTPA